MAQRIKHIFKSADGQTFRLDYDPKRKEYHASKSWASLEQIQQLWGAKLIPSARFINIKANTFVWLPVDVDSGKALYGQRWLTLDVLRDSIGIRYASDTQRIGAKQSPGVWKGIESTEPFTSNRYGRHGKAEKFI